MMYYGLNKIKLAFDVQYRIVLFTLLSYLLSCRGLGFDHEDYWPWLWTHLCCTFRGTDQLCIKS